MRIEYDNIFPHDEQIEKSILASLLSSNVDHYIYIPLLIPEFFYNLNNRKIFETTKQLFGKEKHIDLITVSSMIPDQAIYLTEIMIHNSGVRLAEHIQFLTDIYIRRLIVERSLEMIQNANGKETDKTIQMVDDLNRRINDVYGQFTRPKTIGKISEQSVNDVYRRVDNRKKGNRTGIPCPIVDLKNLLGGWQKSDLIILAARPSMGKTAFALHSALFAAERDANVLFFSVEMDAVRLMDRVITKEAGIIPDNYRDGTLSDNDLTLANNAYYKVKNYPVSIVDRADITVDQIRSICNAMKPDLVIIDYLQIISMPETKNFNMVQEIGKITRKLKIIARELNVPVICLSQLNRGLESRGDKRPVLSDLRESGNIEQDADVVIFLYRDYVYTKQNYGSIEAIIAKHRNGKANLSIEFKHNEYMNNFFDNEEEKIPY